MASPGPAAAVPSFFRSSEMDYISLIVQGHVAHDAIEALGDLGAVQFTDLQPELTPFQRRYTKYIRRCDDMERLIRYFEDEMVKHAISPQVRDVAARCVCVAWPLLASPHVFLL